MHDGHRDRLRKKFEKSGLELLAEHEVLELLLFYAIPRRNTNDIAHRLLDNFGSFSAVCDADLSELVKVDGVGYVAGILIKMIPSLTGYYTADRFSKRNIMRNSTDMGNFASSIIGFNTNETFAVMCFNNQRALLGYEIVDRGTVNESNVSIRKIVAAALKYNASSVVLAHNHPSGIIHPSEEDLSVTGKICDTLESIGISVIDHIIVSGDKFTSLCDRGMMPN